MREPEITEFNGTIIFLKSRRKIFPENFCHMAISKLTFVGRQYSPLVLLV